MKVLFFVMLGLTTSSTFSQTHSSSSEEKKNYNSLANNEKIRKAYEKCSDQKNSNAADITALKRCMFAALPDKEREIVANFLYKKDPDSQAEKGPQLDPSHSVIDNFAQTSPQRKALEKLREYLGKRLRKTLYGIDDDKSYDIKKHVNHKMFYEIYESNLGKNILTSITSFCFEAEEKNGIFRVYEDQALKEAIIKKNMNLLTQPDQAKQKTKAAVHWEKCAVNISKICKNSTTSQDLYTRTRACGVVNNIENFKKAIIENTKIKDELEKLKGMALPQTFLTEYDGTSDKKTDTKNIDQLGRITSKDLELSGYNKALKQKIGDIEDCTRGNDDECEKGDLITQNEAAIKKLEKSTQELELRSLSESALIKDKLTKEEILSMLKKDKREVGAKNLEDLSEDEVKKIIEEKYRLEKQAIIDEMKKRVKRLKNDNKKEVLEIIKDELIADYNNMKQAAHFHNLATAFIEISDKNNDQSFANVGSYKDELEKLDKDLFKTYESTLGNETNRGLSNIDEGYKSRLEEAAGENLKLGEEDPVINNAGIAPETINEKLTCIYMTDRDGKERCIDEESSDSSK